MTTKLQAAAILLAGLLTWAGPGAIRARGAGPQNDGSPATVSGVGEAKVKQAPTLLRMYLPLVARGKTLEEALAALKDRREAAVAKLQTLKGKASSLTFSAPALNADSNANSQRRRMEMMIAQRLGHGKKAPKPVQPPVIVTSLLTADWPLESDTPEKLLLVAGTLRQQVKAADLGGAKESDKLSPEEQEMAEEMAEQMNNMGSPDDESSQAGQPQLLFVAKLADKDRQAAMAEAFTKAKGQAAELAKAAGMAPGRLISLNGTGGGKVDWNELNNNRVYYPYVARMMNSANGAGAQLDETIAPAPDTLEFEFTVTATFTLEPRHD